MNFFSQSFFSIMFIIKVVVVVKQRITKKNEKRKMNDFNWYILKFPRHEGRDNEYFDLKECIIDGIISEETFDKIENFAVKEAMKSFLNTEYKVC